MSEHAILLLIDRHQIRTGWQMVIRKREFRKILARRVGCGRIVGFERLRLDYGARAIRVVWHP